MPVRGLDTGTINRTTRPTAEFPVFMVCPRVAIVAPSEAVVERFQKTLGAHAAVTTVSRQDVAESTNDLLATFAVDVVLVAPACTELVQSVQIPQSWIDIHSNISRDQVIIETKPASALRQYGRSRG